MLKDYPEIRKIGYVISTVLGILLGAVQVGFSAAAAGQPVWLTVALAVYAFLAAALGVTATTNITAPHIDELSNGKGDEGDE